MDGYELRRRFVVAQSWFIASEIVRRHPELRLIETHAAGGQADCLTVCVGAGPEPHARIWLDRNGTLKVRDDDGEASQSPPIPWTHTVAKQHAAHSLNLADSHAVVKRLEAGAELPPVRRTPPSSPATLAYRVASRVLSSLVNDEHAWDLRSERDHTSGWACSDRGYVDQFPTVVMDRRADDIHGVPSYRYWALLRDESPVAILDTDGNVHVDGAIHSLPAVYRTCGRSLTALVGSALGSVLP